MMKETYLQYDFEKTIESFSDYVGRNPWRLLTTHPQNLNNPEEEKFELA
jgi:hypothetical protein